MKTYYVGNIPFNGENSISHHGIKGQKRGIRRFQNEDGSYTLAGKQRYGIGGLFNTIGQKMSSAYSSAKKRVSSAYSSGREFLTGSNAKKAVSKAKAQRDSGTQYYLKGYREEHASERKKAQDLKSAIAKRGNTGTENNRQNYRDSMEAKKHEANANSIGNTIRKAERASTSTNMHRALNIAQAKRQYSNTLPGKVENFTQSASKTIDNGYNEVVDWLEENAEKAKESAKSAKKAISKAGGKAVSEIKSRGSKAAKDVGNFFSRIFGKK